jgi:ankyrin repeat protein
MSGSHLALELGSIQFDMRSAASDTAKRLDSFEEKFKNLQSGLTNFQGSAGTNNDVLVSTLESTVVNTLERLLQQKAENIPSRTASMTPRTQTKPLRRTISFNSRSETQRSLVEKHELGHGIFSIWAIYRSRTCSNSCDCVCHSGRVGPQTWKSPTLFRKLLGLFFATYTGYPIWKQGSHNDTCRRRGSKTVEVVYDFPLWCLKWNIHALLHHGTTGGLTMSLVFRPRMQYRIGSIFHAVDSNNIDMLRVLLQRNPDSINYRLFQSGHTAFHLACMRPRNISFDVFQLLLRAGADLTAEADDGRSVANIIASQVLVGGFPVEHELEISKWASISRYLEDLELSLITEVVVGLRVGDIDTLLRKLPSSSLRVVEFDVTGSTPIYWAAKVGNIGAIQDLVRYGVDVNQKTSSGNTPLLGSFAFDNGSGSFEWLLRNGGDPYLTNSGGYNCLTFACYSGRFDLVKLMILNGVDPTTQDGKGRTGIIAAISYDHDNIVEYLLSVGTDANLPSYWDFVPLCDAVRNNAHRSLQLLLRHGVDHLYLNRKRWSVLHFAASTGDVTTMSILADHRLSGLDVHERTITGHTAYEMFLSRPSTNLEKLAQAFNTLLTKVEMEGKKLLQLGLEYDQDVLEEGEDIFFDTIEYALSSDDR